MSTRHLALVGTTASGTSAFDGNRLQPAIGPDGVAGVAGVVVSPAGRLGVTL